MVVVEIRLHYSARGTALVFVCGTAAFAVYKCYIRASTITPAAISTMECA